MQLLGNTEKGEKKRGEATMKQILGENIPELEKGLRLQIEKALKRSKKGREGNTYQIS